MFTPRIFDNVDYERILRKVVFLHIPILLSLYILTDTEARTNTDDDDGQSESVTRHMAVFTALARHPPSMRVFRGLTMLAFLGLCTAFVLHVLEVTMGHDTLKNLFFSTPYTLQCHDSSEDRDSRGVYELSVLDDCVKGDDDDDDDDDNHVDDNDNVEGNYKEEQREAKTLNETDSTQQSYALYVCEISLNLLLYVLIALFLFTFSSAAGGTYIDQTDESNILLRRLGKIAAPTFPLLLFAFCSIRAVLPWTKKRYYFWTIISYTLGAPMYEVDFRDGFIGDIFTSMVRPMQDIAFTSFYLMSGLQGWWIYRQDGVGIDEDTFNQPVERSWLLHTVVLPACTVSPLWWRFCQCLRQSYETKTRWPYLGNAAKYFFAAQVAMFGVFDPEKRGSLIWMMAFVFATLYQLWWDVFMDWELCVWVPSSSTSSFSFFSSLCGGSFQLRKERLYKYKSMYIFIFVVNVVLRFGWTLNVMPSRYLSPSGALLDTFSADFTTLVVPTLSLLEIIRRSLWGLIRFELEVIKNRNNTDKGMDGHESLSLLAGDERDGRSRDEKLTPMSIGTKDMDGTNSKSSSNVLFLWELCSYATLFTVLGMLAAVHRQVL